MALNLPYSARHSGQLSSCAPMKFLNVSSSLVPLVSFSIAWNIGTVPKRLFGAGGGVHDEYLNSLASTPAASETSAAVRAAAMAFFLCMVLLQSSRSKFVGHRPLFFLINPTLMT